MNSSRISLLKTPILFLIFNRPNTTIQVFEAIKQIKPAHLYIAADGPHTNKPGEDEKCRQTRDMVMNGIDWECEVKTLFREENLGCKYAVSSAINWFFENEEMGIILEDDVLPDMSFFRYCEELFIKYKDFPEIKMISGNSYFPAEIKNTNSYYFCHYSNILGWASWKQAKL